LVRGRLAQTVYENGTSQIEATRLVRDTTNSKLSASTNIIYYYTINMTTNQLTIDNL